jgi:hypothetical protein
MKHYVKMTLSELSTTEPAYDTVSVKVKRTILKQMAKAVGIQKGSPTQIVQTFLNTALTI